MDREGFLRDVNEILDTGIFTNLGPYVSKLEAAVCQHLHVKYTLAVSNATVGLAMVLRALDLPPGGEVILPAYTFIATAHAVHECGLKPVFCDCDPCSHLVGVKQVSACLTSSTVAILAVNLWGLSCDMQGLETFARYQNLHLLFDSAHSFGAKSFCGRFLGNFGTAEVFSLHATKLFNSFEGGLITTNDEGVAKKLAPLRNFGITGQDTVSCWGSNYKMSEMHAAFALRQLQNIEQLIHKYRYNARIYTEKIHEKNIKGLRIWNEDYLCEPGCTHSYVCLEVSETFPYTRDEVVNLLRNENIYAKRYFWPGLHRCEPYKTDFGDLTLPVTHKLCDQVLILPTGTHITAADIERVIALLAELYRNTEGRDKEVATDVSVDTSYLQEKVAHTKALKAKYEKLASECEKDLRVLEKLS